MRYIISVIRNSIKPETSDMTINLFLNTRSSLLEYEKNVMNMVVSNMGINHIGNFI